MTDDFHLPLEMDVDAGPGPFPPGLPLDIMPCEGGQGVRVVRQRLGNGCLVDRFVDVAVLQKSQQQAVAFFEQGVPLFPGVHRGGGVRKDCQRGGFRPGEFGRRSSEIAPRSGVQPDDIPPEGGVGGIQGEDFFLAATDF